MFRIVRMTTFNLRPDFFDVHLHILVGLLVSPDVLFNTFLIFYLYQSITHSEYHAEYVLTRVEWGNASDGPRPTLNRPLRHVGDSSRLD